MFTIISLIGLLFSICMLVFIIVKKRTNLLVYVLGLIIISTVLLIVGVSKQRTTYTVTTTTTTNSVAGNSSKKSQESNGQASKQSNEKKGTLSNPLSINESFTISNIDQFRGGFDVSFTVLDFKDSNELPNFKPKFYNMGTLKDGYTYYAIKLKVKVEKAVDKNKTFYMDALNMTKLMIDGVQADDSSMNMGIDGYPGVDGEMIEGASKEGWIGVQAPTNAKSLIFGIGESSLKGYVKLK